MGVHLDGMTTLKTSAMGNLNVNGSVYFGYHENNVALVLCE